MNISQQLVNELGKEILKGKYQPGDKLPSEAELSTINAMSRTATREAVKMLTAKGLIKSRPRKGIIVNEQKDWNFFDVDVLQWVLVGRPDLTMLRHFLQLRQAIESQAAYLAAQYATEDDIQAIEVALSRMKIAEEGQQETHEADIDYHKAVLSATNNPFFIQLKTFVETALKANLRFTRRMKAVTSDEYEAHLLLLNMIKTKQCEAAFNAANTTQKATLDLVDNEIANRSNVY